MFSPRCYKSSICSVWTADTHPHRQVTTWHCSNQRITTYVQNSPKPQIQKPRPGLFFFLDIWGMPLFAIELESLAEALHCLKLSKRFQLLFSLDGVWGCDIITGDVAFLTSCEGVSQPPIAFPGKHKTRECISKNKMIQNFFLNSLATQVSPISPSQPPPQIA